MMYQAGSFIGRGAPPGGHDMCFNCGQPVIGPVLADSDLKCPDGEAEAEANNLHVATIDEVTTNPEMKDILDSSSSYRSSNRDIPQCQTSSIYRPLVDSFRNDGARDSTITTLPPDTSLTRKTISLVGFKVNLLGRDLLIGTCPLIKCSPDGLILEFPDGNTYCCSAASASGANSQFPLVEQRPVACATADIYWVRVDIDSSGWLEAEHFGLSGHLGSLISDMVTDCMHCTLYYDRSGEEIYSEAFQDIDNNIWELNMGDLFVGKPGVAFSVFLTPEQLEWYKMADPPDPSMPPCHPHVSLMVSPQHTAKDLGPFVLTWTQATDWQNSFHSQLLYSSSLDAYWIQSNTFLPISVLEHKLLDRHHGRETTDSDFAGQLLDSLPALLWSTNPTDVGLCNVSPVAFLMKPGRIYVPQYSVKEAGMVGISDTIDGLLKAGVLCEIPESDYNTPILPVEKKDTGKFRMVHDLRAINAVVLTPTLPVPNPHSTQFQITSAHTHTCIDLANAFFCIPLDPSMRQFFAFTFCYSYNRLPQGFVLSPGLFNNCLRQFLSPLELPNGVLLVQYVDDLLVAAPSETSCLEASRSLLSHLASVGLKYSKSKLQIARPQVSFLGRLISRHGTGMSPSHKDDILHHPKPMNVKTMLAFLVLCNYSRHHVPDFAELTYPLRQMVNDQGMRNLSNILCWTTEADTSFISLKQHLSAAAALAIPDYNRMFYLDASEKVSSLSAALYQKGEGGSRQVCMYASTPLEKYEQRHPICAAFASALARVIQKTSHIVLHHPLTVRTSHSTVQYVTSQATMTGGRQRKIQAILTQPHEGVNMAEGLLEGEPHCCVQRTKEEDSLRTELYETPLEYPDFILFTD
ncbi:LOW QUALITY PROTEIN: uncharacterized protein LOC133515222 [Syngnathoides biaculeatus]|uniref:LOW QUALITY PROTEIN: uncharacterized protein LOC133515222 n=1 Tax=Syngnathoides biaculeatus TaxID=300417 RepID=UPI002ADE3823|nr:LOW QUALITY PROTEIN: uncharacterized protein LOC133515222 [Syngnathoides biaculeatus]